MDINKEMFSIIVALIDANHKNTDSTSYAEFKNIIDHLIDMYGKWGNEK